MFNHLAKEFRPLLLPWFVALGAGLFALDEEVAWTLSALVSFGGLAVVCATTMGIEFQQRTTVLLLSQPSTRFQLWLNKLLAVAVAVLVFVAMNWRVQQIRAGLSLTEGLLLTMFILAVVSSSGFWIRNTDSVLCGIAASLLNQVIVFGGITFALTRFGPLGELNEYGLSANIIAGGMIYSAAFLWLGRSFWKKRDPTLIWTLVFLAVLYWLGGMLPAERPYWRASLDNVALPGMFVLATVCSAGFWTLVARTIIGGTVLTVASQFAVILAIKAICSRNADADVDFVSPLVASTALLIGPIYSALFLWLGWRKFSQLELRELSPGESAGRFANVQRRGFRWLQCEAKSYVLNLARKEIRLQKPVFQLAGIFVLLWGVTALLHWLQPQQGYHNLLDVLLCLYIPLCVILAGSMSLGEEKTLGVAVWQLTLPVATFRQWLVKATLAAASALLLGLAVPWLLMWLRAALTHGTLPNVTDDSTWLLIITASGIFVALSLWASALLTNTVRAALTTVVVSAALIVCASAGSWFVRQFGGLELWVLEIFSIPIRVVEACLGLSDPAPAAYLFFSWIFMLVVLGQSLRYFRRPQPQAYAFLKSFALLAFTAFALSYIGTEQLLSVYGRSQNL